MLNSQFCLSHIRERICLTHCAVWLLKVEIKDRSKLWLIFYFFCQIALWESPSSKCVGCLLFYICDIMHTRGHGIKTVYLILCFEKFWQFVISEYVCSFFTSWEHWSSVIFFLGGNLFISVQQLLLLKRRFKPL